MALSRDPAATAAANLNVLRRMDPEVEEVLGRAGHVCLYNFDTSTQQWVRASPLPLCRHTGSRVVCRERARKPRRRCHVAKFSLTPCSCPAYGAQSKRDMEGSLFVVRRCVSAHTQRRALREERRLTPKGPRTPLSHTQEHAAPLPVHYPEPTQHRRVLRRACM
jgi:hypothetical protein